MFFDKKFLRDEITISNHKYGVELSYIFSAWESAHITSVLYLSSDMKLGFTKINISHAQEENRGSLVL